MGIPMEQIGSPLLINEAPKSDETDTDTVETATWRGRCYTKVRDKRNIPWVFAVGMFVGFGLFVGDMLASLTPQNKVFADYSWCCVQLPAPYENIPAEGACWTGESVADCSQVGIPVNQVENATSTTITTCVENCGAPRVRPLFWVGVSLVGVGFVGAQLTAKCGQ